MADTKSSLAAAATLCRSACRGARIEFVAAAARQLDLDDQQISARIRHVLAGRAVIEQAKGLLAYRHRIDRADVYDQLQHLAHRTGDTLSVTAATLTRAAQHPDQQPS